MNSDASLDFDAIVNDYGPGLRAYIRNRVGNRDDADDILQEVFYQLVRTTTNPDAPEIERLSAWLYRVAHNTILNLWRKKRELTVDSPPGEFEAAGDEAIDSLQEMIFASADAASSSPENVYLRKLVWQELEYALADLPPEQSEVFCLTVFDGVPVKEISESTGVAVATLLSRKHYAVKFLRMRLRGLYDDLLSC